MVSVLTIAGTDSSGGAGVGADLKTFTSLKCYGALAVTALTAQNTLGVQAVHPCPPSFVRDQLKSVFDDIPIHAIKTGMLHNAHIISAIVEYLTTNLNSPINPTLPFLVVDPVTISTSGHTLLAPEAIDTLRNRLLPLATLTTPNVLEAELLVSHGSPSKSTIRDISAMVAAATSIAKYGSKAVLVKGGHLTLTVRAVMEFQELAPLNTRVVVEWADQCGPDTPGILRPSNDAKTTHYADQTVVVDVLYIADSQTTTLVVHPRLKTTSTHGTGCTLSAALACYLAKNYSVLEATLAAIKYTHQGISTAVPLGQGHGPLNHLHPIENRTIPRPTQTMPHPFTCYLVKSTPKLWGQFVQHPFVAQLGRGTLPKENFLHFIKQDYHYLKHYARAYSLLGAKSSTLTTVGSTSKTVAHIVRESGMHQSYCELWGISLKELLSTPESLATTGYGAYLLDAGVKGDETTLLVALASCLLGYGEVGLWLKEEAEKPETGIYINGNPYAKWIEDYSGLEYQAAVREGIELLENRISEDLPSPAKCLELQSVWEKVVKFEIAFWDMSMTLQ